MGQGGLSRIFWLAPLTIAVVVGLWLYARYDVTDRIGDFAGGVQNIGHERGLESIPSEERVEEQVRAIAADLDLELETLSVSIAALSDENVGSVDKVTRDLRAKLGKMERTRFDHEFEEHDDYYVEKYEARRVPVELTGSVVEVRATVSGDKWLWSMRDEVEVRRVLGRRIDMN